jgi:hypothetical protein
MLRNEEKILLFYLMNPDIYNRHYQQDKNYVNNIFKIKQVKFKKKKVGKKV